MRVDVKINLSGLNAFKRTFERAAATAIRDALNDTARQARRDAMDELPKVFDRPTPYTTRSIGYRQATTGRPVATVFVRESQLKYLGLQIEGGTELPKRKALLVPKGVKLNQYGNMGRNKLKALLARKNTFSGRVNGTGGIWERVGGRLRLLVAYDDKRQVKPRFPFVEIVTRSAERRLQANLDRRIRLALKA